MALGGDELGVHGLVRQVEKERPILAALLQPVDRVIGQLVGDVAALRHRFAVDVEAVLAGKVRALTAKADPAVETGLRRIAVATHVPLADERRLVAGLLQMLRKERRPRRDRIVVVDDAMTMRVESGQDRRAARGAQRRRNERVAEVDAVARERVEVRRLEPRVPQEAERVEAQVVDEDEDDVARLRLRNACCGRASRCPRRQRHPVPGRHRDQTQHHSQSNWSSPPSSINARGPRPASLPSGRSLGPQALFFLFFFLSVFFFCLLLLSSFFFLIASPEAPPRSTGACDRLSVSAPW